MTKRPPSHVRLFNSADAMLDEMCLDLGIPRSGFDTIYSEAILSCGGAAVRVRNRSPWTSDWLVVSPFPQVYLLAGRGQYPTNRKLSDTDNLYQGHAGKDVTTFLFVYGGELLFQLDGKRYVIKTNQSVIFRRSPATTRSLKIHWSGNNVRAIALYFTAASLKAVLNYHSIAVPDVLSVMATTRNPERCVIKLRDSLVQKNINANQLIDASDSPLWAELCRFKTAEVLLLMSMLLPDEPTTIASRLSYKDIVGLDLAKSMIDENVAQQPSLEKLSAATGLHPKKISRGFQTLFNQSVREYGKAARLKHARELLLETNENLSWIADNCGYENPNNLTRAFSQYFGHPPSEVRRAIK